MVGPRRRVTDAEAEDVLTRAIAADRPDLAARVRRLQAHGERYRLEGFDVLSGVWAELTLLGGDPDDRRAQADHDRKAAKEERGDEDGDPRMDYDEARDFAREGDQ